MENRVAEILEYDRNNMNREAVIPSAYQLFVVNENTKILSKRDRPYLHTMEYKILLL